MRKQEVITFQKISIKRKIKRIHKDADVKAQRRLKQKLRQL